MNGRGRKAKGACGERELIRILSDRLGVEFARNLEQTRWGGYDLISPLPLAIEVKRQERLDLKNWWMQTLKQARKGTIPILCYRQSRQPWRVIVSLGWLTGLDFDPMAIAQISLDDFCRLVQRRIL